MGLGKTIQVLDLLLQRKRAAGKRRSPPSLLVVPASLLGNWKQEAARFAPALRICLIHRAEMDPDELARRTSDPVTGFADCDLVITSYQTSGAQGAASCQAVKTICRQGRDEAVQERGNQGQTSAINSCRRRRDWNTAPEKESRLIA